MYLKKSVVVLIMIAIAISPIIPITAQQIKQPSYVYGPYIDKITFPVMRDYTMRILAFEANELDLVGVLPRDLSRVRQNRPDAHIIMTVGLTSLGAIHFNVRLWPVKYVELRKAIAHLWNRDKIIAESPLAGIAVKCTTIPPPTHGAWVNPEADYEKLYPYDPEKAKEWLSKVFVPCTGPDGKPAWCDPREGGKVVEIELLTLPQALSPTYYWIAEYIKSEAEKIGLRIKLVTVSTVELVSRTGAGTAQAWIIGWAFGRFPTFMYYFFHSSEIRPGGWNEWGVNDTRVDTLLDKFYFAKSIDEAMKYAHEVQKILVEDWLPWIPTYTGVGITAFNGAIDRDSIVLSYAPPLKDPVGLHWFWWNNVRFKDRKFGGTLRYYFTGDVTTLHPALYQWAYEADLIWRVYTSFMVTKPENIYAEPRIPMLLKDWKFEEFTLPNGSKRYRFTLNLFDGMIWQDGVPITAEDFVYTVTKFGIELKTRRYYDPSLKNIVEIKTINRTAAVVVLKDYGWVDIYLWTEYAILPKHIFERLANPLDDPSLLPHPTIPGLKAMVGNGPFVLVKRDVAYAEVVWNPVYIWRHPERTVLFKKVDVPTSVDAGKSFKISVQLVNYDGVTPVINGTVRVLVSGPRTLGPLAATHIGEGVYELTLPGLEPGMYKLVIEASMPLAIWSLTNVYETTVAVGAITPTPTPTPTVTVPAVPTPTATVPVAPTVGRIEVRVGAVPELKPVTITMPSPITVTTPVVEVVKPTVEVKPIQIVSVIDLSIATIVLAIIIVLISVVLSFIRKRGS
jgi:ABC-type transport system substrate-binding protein